MRYLLSLFLLLLASNSSAFVYPSGPNNFPNTATGNAIQYINSTVNPANIATFDIAHTAGGPVTASSTEKIGLPSGRSASVVVKATPTALAVAGALGRFAAKMLPTLSGVMAIKQLADELGYIFNPDGTVQRADTSVCTVAPCVEYQYHVCASLSSVAYGPWSSVPDTSLQSSLDACNVYVAARPGTYGTSRYFCKQSNSGYSYYTCGLGTSVASATASIYRATRTVNPATSNLVQSSAQAFTDAIAAKSGWPSGSAVVPAIREAVTQGESIPVPAPDSITGPASVAGPTTTKTTVSPSGTTTSNTATTYNFNYSPTTVTVTQSTVTTTTNPDGTTETSTEDSSDDEGVPSDTPLSSIPVLYERKYPDGLSGVWQQKKAALTSSPLLSLVSGLMPSVALTGTCPVLMVNLDVGFQNFGSHDFAPPCWVWDFGRIVVIASALLLARALIFGG